jgi:hypothetical protein
MQVQNVECRLAQAQIARYLAGENLPDDTIQELERHLARCAGCREALAVRRQALVGSPARVAATAAPRSAWGRTVAFSAALALVLVGMSFFPQLSAQLLGPKAKAEARVPAPAVPPPSSDAMLSRPPSTIPPVVPLRSMPPGQDEVQPIRRVRPRQEEQTAPVAPSPRVASTGPALRRPAIAVQRRTASMRAPRRAPIPSRPAVRKSTIRVFDPDGRPLEKP